MPSSSARWAVVKPWWTLALASLAPACGSSQKASEGTHAVGGRGGDSSAAAGQVAAGTSGTAGSADAAGGKGTGGASAGGHSAAGSGAGGMSTAGAGAGAGPGAGAGGMGAGAAGVSGVVVGNGELDDSCQMRTSASMAGSRIVLRNAVTSEGDKAFIGFYDTEKQTACQVTLDAEGKYRCMPPALDKDLVNRFYLDDQCTQEIEYRGACSLDHQAVPVSSDPCDKRRRIIPYGEPIADTMVYSPRTDGTCQPYSNLNNLYMAGEELVPADYAELEPVIWRGKGRLWAEGYQGDGGLHMVSGVRDSSLDQSCTFAPLADRVEHCVPDALGVLSYTDPTCAQTLLAGMGSCGAPAPTYASSFSGDICNPSSSFVRATGAYSGDVYVQSTCQPSTSTGVKASVTEAVPDGDFVSVTSTTLDSDGGRLRPMYRTATDGGCFFHDWWDEDLQIRCSFTQYFSADQYYCLPVVETTTHWAEVDLYTDAECMTDAPYVKLLDCDGAKPPPFLSGYAPSCGGTWRTIRAVDPTPTAVLPSLFTYDNTTCVPFEPEAGVAYYATGPELPTSTFVAGVPDN